MPGFVFDNTYARLPERFFARLNPTPVRAPALVRVNAPLAETLGLDPAALASPEGVAILAGNSIPPGAEPIAQAYSGHQFGGFSPQLGDGRAILLGEVVGRDGQRRDIQLKGSGPTPFSRRGDGRAALGPVLREYIVAEAMAALGIPTTRALAAVTTGEPVWREGALPGAILTRVAPSHLRVGTFQYFAAREDIEALQLLTEMAIARHYPDATGPLDLLRHATRAQARLIAQWQGVGFIHGVMNTDNAHVGGITIDYGPCAFLDGWDPDKVFSSIDHKGRYAYAMQPRIAAWNMAQLASCLLPLIHEDMDTAVELATEVIHAFEELHRAEWLTVFRAKLGLADHDPGDMGLIQDLLAIMQAAQADFTITFRALAEGDDTGGLPQSDARDAWIAAWRARAGDMDQARALMRAANPAIIPRNHRIEAAIASAVSGDMGPFQRLSDALARPFDAPVDDPLRSPPAPREAVCQTFCGT